MRGGGVSHRRRGGGKGERSCEENHLHLTVCFYMPVDLVT